MSTATKTTETTETPKDYDIEFLDDIDAVYTAQMEARDAIGRGDQLEARDAIERAMSAVDTMFDNHRWRVENYPDAEETEPKVEEEKPKPVAPVRRGKCPRRAESAAFKSLSPFMKSGIKRARRIERDAVKRATRLRGGEPVVWEERVVFGEVMSIPVGNALWRVYSADEEKERLDLYLRMRKESTSREQSLIVADAFGLL